MVDTAAAVSLLSSKMWCALGGEKVLHAVISVGWKTVGWCGGGGQPCNGTGSVRTTILRFVDQVLQADFVVVDRLIGLDFLEAHHSIIDLPNKLLQLSQSQLQKMHPEQIYCDWEKHLP